MADFRYSTRFINFLPGIGTLEALLAAHQPELGLTFSRSATAADA
jgi:hypothetical protein